MTKILETEWNNFLNNIDFSSIPFINQIFLKSDENNNLKKYLALEHHPSMFNKKLTTEDIFYNKYRYFLKFKNEQKKVLGSDEGLEQQAFKILETGDDCYNVDWNVINRISTEVEG